jgi:hypothetical protein
MVRLKLEPPVSSALSGLTHVSVSSSQRSSAAAASSGGGGRLGGGGGGGGVASLEVGGSVSKGDMLREGLLDEVGSENNNNNKFSFVSGNGGDEAGGGSGGGGRLLPGSGSHVRAREGRVMGAKPTTGCVALVLRPLALLASLFALLLATAWVPQNWELLTKNSLIDYAATKTFAHTEKQGSSMTTKHWTLSDGGDDDDKASLVLHFFPDCVIFYSFLAFLVVVGGVSRLHRGTERWLKERVLLLDDSQPPAKWWWTWIGAPPWSISKGGIVVLSAFTVSLGCYLSYWDQMHEWHKGETIEKSAHAARVFGQLANFLMGVMLFPVSKNSILTACFGIAWEQASGSRGCYGFFFFFFLHRHVEYLWFFLQRVVCSCNNARDVNTRCLRVELLLLLLLLARCYSF